MAKPTIANAAWATDGTFSTSPSAGENGTNTKTSPGAAYLNEGFVPGKRFISQYVNYFLNQLYQWCQYLNTLHSDSDFLSQNYAWTGNHDFENTVDITAIGSNPALNVDGNITAAVGNITATAGNVVATAGDVQAGDDVIAGGDFTYSTPPTRTKLVPLRALADGPAVGQWFYGSSYDNLFTDQNEVAVLVPIDLPHGATLTRVRAGVSQGGAAVTDMKLSVYKCVQNLTTPSSVSTTQLGSTDTHSGSGDDVLTTLTGGLEFSEVIDNTTTTYHARVTSSDNASLADDAVYWIEIKFTDPGPRNN